MGVGTVGDLARLDPVAVIASARPGPRPAPDRSRPRPRRPPRRARARAQVDRATRRRSPSTSTTSTICAASSFGWPTPWRRGCAPTASAARTFTLKVRDGTFATITRAVTGRRRPRQRRRRSWPLTAPLLERLDLAAGVRLLGLAASRFAEPAEQLPSRRRRRRRRGPTPRPPSTASGSASATPSIGPASGVAGGRLRVVRRGAQQWGPDHDAGDRDGSDNTR